MSPVRRRRLPLAVTTLIMVLLTAAACSHTGSTESAPPASRATGEDAEFATFTDVASEVGLDFIHSAFAWSVTGDPNAMMGGGLCWIDVDADGWLDLFLINTWSDGEWGKWDEGDGIPTTRLFRNDEGTFVDITDQAGAGLEVRGNGCVAADLDNDGYPDLYVTTERDNVLLWNNAGLGFEADDGSAGVDAYGWHSGAAIGDVNQDGWPDLFVAGYADLNAPDPGATRGFPNTFMPEPDLLFLNNGSDGENRPAFTEVASDVGIEANQFDYGLGAVLADVDRDGDLDLYVANDTQPNRLYLNELDSSVASGLRFTDIGPGAGVDDDNAGMGIASADFDHDGLPDIVVTNMAEQGHDVFASRAGAAVAFTGVVEALGLADLGQTYTGWGTSFADVDNDGDLDLVVAHGAIPVIDTAGDRQPVEIFEQTTVAGSVIFRDRSDHVRTAAENGYLGRGLAAADYDNDGDIDFAVGTIGGQVGLLRNDTTSESWLIVAVSPATPGTIITVRSTAGTQQRELIAGSSYLSSEDPRAHFGFGSSRGTEVRVEVSWPDGRTVERDGVSLGRILQISSDE